MHEYYVIIIPAAGGLIVWAIIKITRSSEAKGHGVPEVMSAVIIRGGRIRARIALSKILASSVCIGSGGSVGREGPIVQIGSTIGSSIGSWLGLSTDWVKTLVACGAAGGISATFNAPLAGIFFAGEVILGRIFTKHFGFVLISSVIAAAVAHILLGDLQSFDVPVYNLTNNWELITYFGLGITCAVVALAFVWLLYKTEDFFDKLRLPGFVKPVIGGLMIGIMGWYAPYIFGVGYEGVEQALHGNIGLISLLILLGLKLLATSITIGSGGSGGIFAPSLFIGAMYGGVFGSLANRFLPNIVGPQGGYSMVGMAAVFAAAARAPITAIIIVFEMTRDYAIILPVMLAVAASTFIARTIYRESIYTTKLTRQGINISRREEIDVLEKILVSEIMTRRYPFVNTETSIEELRKMFRDNKFHSLPVIDKNKNFKGMVSIKDLESCASGDSQCLTVSDICTTCNLVVAYPDESLHEVMNRLGIRDLARIPVADRKKPTRLVGILRRSDIINAYTRSLSERNAVQES